MLISGLNYTVIWDWRFAFLMVMRPRSSPMQHTFNRICCSLHCSDHGIGECVCRRRCKIRIRGCANALCVIVSTVEIRCLSAPARFANRSARSSEFCTITLRAGPGRAVSSESRCSDPLALDLLTKGLSLFFFHACPTFQGSLSAMYRLCARGTSHAVGRLRSREMSPRRRFAAMRILPPCAHYGPGVPLKPCLEGAGTRRRCALRSLHESRRQPEWP